MDQELLKRLDVLAAKLGTTAEHLWAVLIRQARIEALTDVIFLVVCLVGGVQLFRLCLWFWKKGADDNSCSDEKFYICSFLCGAGVVVVLCVGIACLFSLPTEIFNPEYFALTKVLSALK